jgi:hypothetical protein
MRFRTVALAAIAALGPAIAWGFDLKGVELGQFASDEQIHVALGIVCLLGNCSAGQTVIPAGVGCDTAIIFNDQKRVDEIVARFAFTKFELVRDALVSTYGPPTQQALKTEVSSDGLKLTRWIGVWRDSDGNELLLMQYSDALHGTLSMRTPARIKLEKQQAHLADKLIADAGRGATGPAAATE